MHDLDRTYRELQGETFEYEFNAEGEWNEVFNENELNELATELLEVAQERELEQFLGRLIKKVGQTLGKAVRSPAGQALGSALKSLAKKALPAAGVVLGNIAAPGAGGMIGGQLGALASDALGQELEGLSQEDREFETAKNFVRIASTAAKTALAAPHAASHPRQAAVHAVEKALQRHAPGLAGRDDQPHAGDMSGRWVRTGNRIVLYGV